MSGADQAQLAVEVAFAGLVEVGRRDLALLIRGFDHDDGFGFYLEVWDEVLSEADWELVNKAEELGRQAIGQAPLNRDRDGVSS